MLVMMMSVCLSTCVEIMKEESQSFHFRPKKDIANLEKTIAPVALVHTHADNTNNNTFWVKQKRKHKTTNKLTLEHRKSLVLSLLLIDTL